MPLTPEGWTLLKTREGCRLSACPDPASGGAPWTIGYGHTGPEVVAGLTISQEQAEAWLQRDAGEAARSVDQLLEGVALTPRQRDANRRGSVAPPPLRLQQLLITRSERRS